jgi:hypothetical protein
VFAEALRLATEDFGALVVDNVSNAAWHFRASDPGPFHMFHPKAWLYSKQRDPAEAARGGACATGRSKDGVVVRVVRGRRALTRAP